MQNNQDTHDELNRILSILFKRKWNIISCIIGVLLPVIYFTMSSKPVFKATAKVVCEERTSSIPDLGFQNLSLTSSFVVNQIQEIESRSLIREVVDILPDTVLDTFPIKESKIYQSDMKRYFTSIIQKHISTVSVPKSEVIQIHAEAYDAKAASIIANAVAEKLKQRNLNTRLEEIHGVEKVIEEQLMHFSRRVKNAEEALKGFKERNRVTYLDEESVEIFKRITESEVEYNRVQSEHEASRKRLQFVQTKLARERKELIPSITMITSPWAQKLKEKLVDLEVQYTFLRVQNYLVNHPKMKILKSQIDATKRNLKAETLKIAHGENIVDPLSRIEEDLEEITNLEVQIYTYEAREKALKKVLGNYSNLLKGIPEKELELGRLMRDKEVADNIYTMLLKKREETKIQKAERAGNIRIIDSALVPKDPIRPRKKLNIILGAFLGMLIGMGLAFFFEFNDTRITNIEDIEKNISFKVLGSIPKIKNEHSHRSKLPFKLLAELDPKSSSAEAFKTLRTNVLAAKNGSDIKTILVTSSNPGEGKSYIASNLGIATAQQGLKTLLIDADLRKPTLHRLFNIEMQPGLLDLLCALSDSREFPPEIRKALFVFYKTRKNVGRKSFVYSTYIRNLFVMTSGMIPPNPSECLSLKTMENLVKILRDHFDLLIFDLPPATDFTDAAVMAHVSDSILFVVSSGKSKVDEVVKAKNSIDKVRQEIFIGAVLNNVHERNGYHTYYRYQGYSSKKKQKRGNRQKVVIDRSLIRNKNANEAFLEIVKNEIVSNVNSKWAKVTKYL